MSANLSESLDFVPDNLRTWVAENLALGGNADHLIAILIQNGVSPNAARAELSAATQHPYIKATERYINLLKKREWLLQTYDQLQALGPQYGAIERTELPSVSDFIENYYSKNKPVIFTGAVEHWKALRNWTPEYFSDHYGASQIEIQFGRDTEAQYERHSYKLKKNVSVAEYVDMIKADSPTNSFYMTANNFEVTNSNLSGLFDDISDIGDGYLDVTKFKSQGYIWFGPAGTITPLHHDLTNNLFVQVYGRKRFRLIPALQVPLMYNFDHVFSSVDLMNPDFQRFPAFANARIFDFELHPGETLFIPIGWWHHVIALDISISLSFTSFKNMPNDFKGYI